MRVDVSSELLSWACERAGYDVEHFTEKFPNLPAWINGELKPTFKQLEDFSRKTYTPLGYLFLDKPPKEHFNIPDFRTIGNRTNKKLSLNLRDTINTMRYRQDWLRESLIETGVSPLPFVGSAKLDDDPLKIAQEIRRKLKLDSNWTNEVNNWESAVSKLWSRIDSIRIMAIITGIVGSNTRRKLDVKEFRGFALSDPYAPLIFVNGADSKAAQIFTLAHELAHIWLGKEGLSGFPYLNPPTDNKIEKWCNAVAAESLVPAKQLIDDWKTFSKKIEPFHVLSRKYKVSPAVIARRALDLKFIDQKRFKIFYDELTSQKHKKTEGGNYFTNKKFSTGMLFGREVLNAAFEGRIGFREAYNLTEMYGGTFQKYYETHFDVKFP